MEESKKTMPTINVGQITQEVLEELKIKLITSRSLPESNDLHLMINIIADVLQNNKPDNVDKIITLQDLRKYYQSTKLKGNFWQALLAKIEKNYTEDGGKIGKIPYILLMILDPKYQNYQKGLLDAWINHCRNKEKFPNMQKLWRAKKITRDNIGSWTKKQDRIIENFLSKNPTLMQNIISANEEIPDLSKLKDNNYASRAAASVLIAILAAIVSLAIFILPLILLCIKSTLNGAAIALAVVGGVSLTVCTLGIAAFPLIGFAVSSNQWDFVVGLAVFGAIACVTLFVIAMIAIVVTTEYCIELPVSSDVEDWLQLLDVDQIQTLEELDTYLGTKAVSTAPSSVEMIDMTKGDGDVSTSLSTTGANLYIRPAKLLADLSKSGGYN